ncbi:C1QL [Mytilus edulis]|uniref:C1QL n=1 Tax=Mytilus edulis TaxID=6550 RepID=A0A8S3UN89_MYTED|nr:C1QL [Mytilus edulis]
MASVVFILFSCVSLILVSDAISTKDQEDVLHAIKSAYDKMKIEVSTLKEELTLLKQKNCECATNIDSNNNKGPRFLVPNGQAPVAFHTHLSANFNVSSNDAVAYDVVKVNVGDGYNKFSGIFKAPATGLYFITNTVMSMPNHGIHVEIVKNGVAIGKNWADHNGYESGTMSVITDLDVNDSVWVRDSDGGTERLEHDYNSFSGFLIYTEY